MNSSNFGPLIFSIYQAGIKSNFILKLSIPFPQELPKNLDNKIFSGACRRILRGHMTFLELYSKVTLLVLQIDFLRLIGVLLFIGSISLQITQVL